MITELNTIDGINRYNACKKDYSLWLSTIPSQIGLTISQGNKIFSDEKMKFLKIISKKYNLNISTLKTMFPD